MFTVFIPLKPSVNDGTTCNVTGQSLSLSSEDDLKSEIVGSSVSDVI